MTAAGAPARVGSSSSTRSAPTSSAPRALRSSRRHPPGESSICTCRGSARAASPSYGSAAPPSRCMTCHCWPSHAWWAARHEARHRL
eukprot:CAMPEP_0119475094 /NCGR_PEP_ID=MMETSP1344-20130328/6114_1 /TAXON_ID=236787 /ORGANISM="Florenciella parvula, Strain CCMP2471" /LENGTH=86 /DNA_ID=CAMNT_0007508541 /DNA_START=77 /DNA_END=337 /DNA_ORIENTATION=-